MPPFSFLKEGNWLVLVGQSFFYPRSQVTAKPKDDMLEPVKGGRGTGYLHNSSDLWLPLGQSLGQPKITGEGPRT